MQKMYKDICWHTSLQNLLLLLLSCFSHVRLGATPWTAAYQAPPSMDFPGESTGVGCHCLLRFKPFPYPNHHTATI